MWAYCLVGLKQNGNVSSQTSLSDDDHEINIAVMPLLVSDSTDDLNLLSVSNNVQDYNKSSPLNSNNDIQCSESHNIFTRRIRTKSEAIAKHCILFSSLRWDLWLQKSDSTSVEDPAVQDNFDDYSKDSNDNE